MKKTILILLVFVTFFSNKIFAQDSGYIKFEITDFKADNPDDPQMKMVENMIKATTTKLYFEKERALTKINSMGGMSTVKIIMDKDSNGEMYMEMMGQKILVKMPKDEIEKMKKENDEKDAEYIHHKDQTKEILGYKTHLVEIKTPDQKSAVMTLWVTEDIKTNGMVSQGMDNSKIGGFPLEYTVSVPGQFSMTTKATEFKKDFDKSVFDFDKTGYKEMSMDDLQNMGGGAGF
ncbi:MAG TPA: hypothetical protein ENI82_01340 [Bacteroidetes bacterium]|nr:hypothetical protein [Bacteroidota bacterium]